jgi:hypothetical protein
MRDVNNNEQNTFSNGCLGSHIDEERSEMRYVMRIAKPVSHQNFERILHFPRGVCLLECLFIPTKPYYFSRIGIGFEDGCFCMLSGCLKCA